MRWKEAFIYTLRQDPAEAETVSHKLMMRASMIQKLSSGIYIYLPLGYKVIKKIENIIREELDKAGCTELLMPTVIPADLWKESGRWGYYGKELLRFKDRKGNDFCLGPTHEEVITDVARKSMRSYRDYPQNLYQIQSKFRDEIRPRFGLMRGREFIMKDGYSFHTSEGCLDKTYYKMFDVYVKIFERLGLKFRAVEADSGAIGGSVTHEFHVLAQSGEDKIISCPKCPYAANSEKAQSKYCSDFAENQTDKKPYPVETFFKKSVEDVAKHLSVDKTQIIKMLVYVLDGPQGRALTRTKKYKFEMLVCVLIRGDLECNEIKVRNYFGANTLDVADESKLLAAGFEVGYMGPINFKKGIKIVADHSIKTISDGVVGANIQHVHAINVSPKRDLGHLEYADFAFADAGDACPLCGAAMEAFRGIEVGQVFKLGDKYSKSMGMFYADENGENKIPLMGCYGIGVGRTLAAAIEQNCDEDGIILPKEIAPFEHSVILLDPDDEKTATVAEKIYESLKSRGIDVLLDDRHERPGVKFKDHDLIGIPKQTIVGKRSVDLGLIENKDRLSGVKESLDIKQLFEILDID